MTLQDRMNERVHLNAAFTQDQIDSALVKTIDVTHLRWYPAMFEVDGFKQRLMNREKTIAAMPAEEQAKYDQSSWRHSNEVIGFLSIEQAKKQVTSETQNLARDVGLTLIGDHKIAFMVDDNCWGYGVLPKGFIGVSVGRQRSEQDVDDFVAKWVLQGEKHLDSVVALCNYLNENYPNG